MGPPVRETVKRQDKPDRLVRQRGKGFLQRRTVVARRELRVLTTPFHLIDKRVLRFFAPVVKEYVLPELG